MSPQWRCEWAVSLAFHQRMALRLAAHWLCYQTVLLSMKNSALGFAASLTLHIAARQRTHQPVRVSYQITFLDGFL
jgi:hypothetical protein